MLFVDIKLDETLRIGKVSVTLVHKSGKKARLRIDADPSIQITQFLSEKPEGKQPVRAW